MIRYRDVNWNVPVFLEDSFRYTSNFVSECVSCDNLNPVKYISANISIGSKNGKHSLDISNVRLPDFIRQAGIIPVFRFYPYNFADLDTDDENLDMFLDIIMSMNGEVEVISDSLYRYIKRRYPNIPLVASPFKSLYGKEQGREIEFYNKLLDRYDRVILSPEYVKNKFLSESDKICDHSRLEIIVNNRCVKSCPVVHEHNNCMENGKEFNQCPKLNMSARELYDSSLALSSDDVDNIIQNTGVRTFNIKDYDFTFEEYRFTLCNYVLERLGVSSFFIYLANSV